MAKAINAKDKAGRAEGVAKVKAAVVEQLAAEFPEQGRDIGHEIEEVEYRVMRAQVLDKGERVDGRDTDTVRPITIETERAAAGARLGALHARPDPGAGGRDARHRRRRAAHRQHRRGARDDQVVHAALQLPALLHRRSQDDPRHQPPRNRARRAGRAGAAAAAAARTRSSPTPCASSRKSSSRTAPRRWPPSAAARWR